eukprot:CAMPEP_0179084866 /NCGR_PEP_ID=MMETSP0796-20121207/38402_1 /TAXON_ID=73915 /ORGANISM="Pyrodinium bahamense, Strain pbaha01" /LENGTH=203 /DNA_ID=CAMNT_0020782293 /DNA_START=30 /DNA_END=641 /DNA_ORIENTATION=+
MVASGGSLQNSACSVDAFPPLASLEERCYNFGGSSACCHLNSSASLPQPWLLALAGSGATRAHSKAMANAFLVPASPVQDLQVEVQRAGAVATRAEEDSAFAMHNAVNTLQLAERAARVSWMALAVAGGMAVVATMSACVGLMGLRRSTKAVEEAESELDATGWPAVLRVQREAIGRSALPRRGLDPPVSSPLEAMRQSLQPE